MNKLKNMKIAIIGSGGNGCEIMRNFALLGCSSGNNGSI